MYFDFVLRSQQSLINIPGTMGVGSNNHRMNLQDNWSLACDVSTDHVVLWKI